MRDEKEHEEDPFEDLELDIDFDNLIDVDDTEDFKKVFEEADEEYKRHPRVMDPEEKERMKAKIILPNGKTAHQVESPRGGVGFLKGDDEEISETAMRLYWEEKYKKRESRWECYTPGWLQYYPDEDKDKKVFLYIDNEFVPLSMTHTEKLEKACEKLKDDIALNECGAKEEMDADYPNEGQIGFYKDCASVDRDILKIINDELSQRKDQYELDDDTPMPF